MAKNVIHAGGIFPNPTLNREGAAAETIMPGSVVVFYNGQVKKSVDGTDAAILYVANFDYLRCKTVNDALDKNDLVIGIHPLQGMFLNVRAAKGDYKKGAPLKVVSGQLEKGDAESAAFYVEETASVSKDGELLRVVVK